MTTPNFPRLVIKKARTYLTSVSGTQYRLGGRSYEFIDCRGLVGEAGELGDWDVTACYGGQRRNVRRYVKGAREAGLYIECKDLTYDTLPPLKKADAIVWYEPSKVGEDPDNMEAVRHIGLYIGPPTKARPYERVISAYNPKFDVLIHDLRIKGYKVHGIIRPKWSLAVALDPIEDPEPPIA